MDTAGLTTRHTVSHLAVLGGRILIAFIFVSSGLTKIGIFQSVAGHMGAKGLPAAGLLLTLAILVEVLGGLAVIAGFKARWAALALAAFLVPVTFVFHNFWAVTGMEQQMQMSMFMKNLCIIGGLLVIFGFGAGRFSVDAWLERRRLGREPEGTPRRAEGLV